MAKSELGLRSKRLYKIKLGLLKYIPFIIALLYFANSIVTTFGITIPLLSYIGGLSLLPFIYIYASSIVYRYCFYHRLFLLYILVDDLINIIDLQFTIPINDLLYLMLHTLLMYVFINIALFKHLKNVEHNKKTIATNS